MISRTRILDAAAKVYAEAGYRGATTRRIADAAGVNEITIFRLFGSKAALIDDAIRTRSGVRPEAQLALPTVPADPERELVAWCAAHLAQLRADRSLICMTMSEMEERPDAAPCAMEGAASAAHGLSEYMKRIRLRGYTSYDAREDGDLRIDPHAAGTMLMAALFADAMGREVNPGMYPQPPERAPAMYVRCFLRAVGFRQPAGARKVAKAAAKPAPSRSRSKSSVPTRKSPR